MHFMRADYPRNRQFSPEDRLNKALQLIGELNVQVNEIQSIFSVLKKFPKNKKDFSELMKFLSVKALSIVNADWILFRIIDSVNLRTLTETANARGGLIQIRHTISNTALVQNLTIDGYSVVKSGQQNISIETFCVLPTNAMRTNQRILIEIIVNLVEMFFVIYRPEYLISFSQKEYEDQANMVNPSC